MVFSLVTNIVATALTLMRASFFDTCAYGRESGGQFLEAEGH